MSFPGLRAKKPISGSQIEIFLASWLRTRAFTLLVPCCCLLRTRAFTLPAPSAGGLTWAKVTTSVLFSTVGTCLVIRSPLRIVPFELVSVNLMIGFPASSARGRRQAQEHKPERQDEQGERGNIWRKQSGSRWTGVGKDNEKESERAAVNVEVPTRAWAAR